MNKISSLATVFSIVLVVSFLGCDKDESGEPIVVNKNTSTIDTIPPVVWLNGGDTFHLVLNSILTDPGASANDLEDGNLPTTVSGTFNKDLAGDYILTYTATDSSGNSGSITRVVHVYNVLNGFQGVYTNCSYTCQLGDSGTFTATVTLSDSINKEAYITNFGGFGNQVTIKANFSNLFIGSPINFDTPQSLGGTSVLEQTFNGESYVIMQPGGPDQSFQVRYQWSDGIITDTCTSVYHR